VILTERFVYVHVSETRGTFVKSILRRGGLVLKHTSIHEIRKRFRELGPCLAREVMTGAR
jgi:hypothetical protein